MRDLITLKNRNKQKLDVYGKLALSKINLGCMKCFLKIESKIGLELCDL